MLSFESVKSVAQAALIKQVTAGCVAFWEENLLAKQSPEKLLETTSTTKMAMTLDIT